MTGELGELGELAVGLIGAGWMGHVHARAHLRLPHHLPAPPLRSRMVAVADPVASQRDDAVRRYGFETVPPTGRT